MVLDQNLKNNSFVTFTNTNVWRAGSFYDANVSALKTKPILLQMIILLIWT